MSDNPKNIFLSKEPFVTPTTQSLVTVLAGVFLIVSFASAQAQVPDAPQTPSPPPFDPAETQHGFSEFDTIPIDPSESSPAPLPYYNDPSELKPNQEPSSHRKPKGLFLDITLAREVEEDLEIRHGNLYYPVEPTDQFPVDASSIYLVFRVFKHYQAYQVIGQVFSDNIHGLSPNTLLDEDMAYLKLEDESGYLKFFPPTEQGWNPGHYHIDIFVGYEANEISRMGRLRFQVTP